MKLRTRYSAWSLFASARQGQADWAPAWRDAEPKARYDVIIIGGGGHGITNVAVLEAGWIGGGNTGRNTTIVRSNCPYPGHTPPLGERPSKPTGSKSVSATPSEEVSQRTNWCIANATISSRSVDCSKG